MHLEILSDQVFKSSTNTHDNLAYGHISFIDNGIL